MRINNHHHLLRNDSILVYSMSSFWNFLHRQFSSWHILSDPSLSLCSTASALTVTPTLSMRQLKDCYPACSLQSATPTPSPSLERRTGYAGTHVPYQLRTLFMSLRGWCYRTHCTPCPNELTFHMWVIAWSTSYLSLNHFQNNTLVVKADRSQSSPFQTFFFGIFCRRELIHS